MSEVYNPPSQLEDYYIPPKIFSNDPVADIEYFRVKARYAKSPEARAKYQKQLELLEDAVVIYREERLPDPYRLPAARQYHALPSFPFEHTRVRNFLMKLLDF
jgi:hypothetical protein